MSAIHWFRKGLRLHDNPALLAALQKHKKSQRRLVLRPVFVLDPWFRSQARVGPNRWRFLVQSLQDLDESLRELGSRLYVLRGSPNQVFPARVGPNRWRFLVQSLQDLDDSLRELGSRLYVLRGSPNQVFPSLQDLDDSLRELGSRLYVLRGSPNQVFPELFRRWEVEVLTMEVDTEPYALKRDDAVAKLAKHHGVSVVRCVSHTLWDVDAILARNNGRSPGNYTGFQKLVSQLGPPAKPLEAPAELHPDSRLPEGETPSASASAEEASEQTSDEPSEGASREEPTTSSRSEDSEETSELLSDVSVPTLEELGVSEEDLGDCLYPGGETAALQRMDDKVSQKRAKWVKAFAKPETSPNSLEPSTTVLSPYLKFGCLSPRTLYWRLQEILSTGGSHTQPPVSLVGQLLWREFYYACSVGTANFDRMVGNPVCRQIGWDEDAEALEAWAHGRTGFPWIDACMRQLRQEGWIHHLARHAVACFLTRGDLWISWERGQEVFEELLLDGDWALNAGNWQWLSCSAFFHQFFRVYSPIAFGKKTDPNGDFIRKYVPEVARFPRQWVYEPWLAPPAAQKAARCVIGTDYPKPIVNHAKVSKANIQRMKEAFAANKAAAASSSDAPPSPPKKKARKAK